jgi:rhamnogalacturonyl hydrolase YesR
MKMHMRVHMGTHVNLHMHNKPANRRLLTLLSLALFPLGSLHSTPPTTSKTTAQDITCSGYRILEKTLPILENKLASNEVRGTWDVGVFLWGATRFLKAAPPSPQRESAWNHLVTICKTTPQEIWVEDADNVPFQKALQEMGLPWKTNDIKKSILRNKTESLRFPEDGWKNKRKDCQWRSRWGWCDALFMAPPMWACVATNPKYNPEMEWELIKEWKQCQRTLQSTSGLFWRDTLEKKKNPQIFWGRGNGWVAAGGCLVDKEFKEKKQVAPQIFRNTSLKILRAAPKNKEGLWTRNLSHDGPTETSGSSLLLFSTLYLTPSHSPLLLPKLTSLLKKEEGGYLRDVQPKGKSPTIVPEKTPYPALTPSPSPQVTFFGEGAYLLCLSQALENLALAQESHTEENDTKKSSTTKARTVP